MASDHITDAMVEAAIVAQKKIIAERFPEAARWPYDYDEDEQQFQRDTMRAALLAAERAAWQSIETAPRDGSTILVEGGPVEWRGYGWFSLKAQRSLQWEPTQWRPLPPPEPSHD